ncbi:Alpha/Beta hydrolase protein [Mycena vitilis]|nr:Alpha/Beta hydrolase protein [Mycena vitilis]
MAAKQIHQPIHPSMVEHLDSEYVKFHNETLAYIEPPHTLTWSPALRNKPAVPGGTVPPLVGKTKEFKIPLNDPKFEVRVFTPHGTSPREEGWPCFIFFHGGGWTFGSIDSENSFAANMCNGAQCVAIAVDYRLAPENPYPAAVEDAVATLDWVIADPIRKGENKLNIDIKRIAVGGSSSGGNLAAILTLKAAEAKSLPSPLVFQLLIVPVTDNTADVGNEDEAGLWWSNRYTPWLSPERMLWFRKNYLPNEKHHTQWDASPTFAPCFTPKKNPLNGESEFEVLTSVLPKAWIAVCERDILRNEGVAYGHKLSKSKVPVEIVEYKGAPHPIMAMDGDELKIGEKMVKEAADALKQAFEQALDKQLQPELHPPEVGLELQHWLSSRGAKVRV